LGVEEISEQLITNKGIKERIRIKVLSFVPRFTPRMKKKNKVSKKITNKIPQILIAHFFPVHHSLTFFISFLHCWRHHSHCIFFSGLLILKTLKASQIQKPSPKEPSRELS